MATTSSAAGSGAAGASTQGQTGGATTTTSNATNTTTNTTTTAGPPPPAAPQTQQEVDRIVLNYLNQKGYKYAEYMLKHEAKIMLLEEMAAGFNPAETGDGTVPGFVMLYDRSDMGNPEAYDIAYSALRRWVGSSLDFYKPELMSVLFPLFVHSYLNLVSKDLKENARKFMENYRADHMELHAQDMARLATITDAQQVKENELAQMYRTNKYHVRLSQVSFELLMAFLQDNKFMVLLRIVNQHLNIQVTATSGQQEGGGDDVVIGITGHGSNQLTTFNQQKVTLGPLPMDPAFQSQVEQTLKEEEARATVDNAMNGDVQPSSLLEDFKKVKTEAGVDSPSRDDIPLPPLKGSDIQAEIETLRDLRKRVSLGPGSLPSICAYTFHNTNDNMNCVAVSQDTTFMAAGFSESYVRLWSLKGEKLRGMRSNFNPATINDSTDLDRLKEKGSESKRLIGHSGPVFGASFSPDNKYLITCSEDKTARLWSTNTFTNLVCYRGHNYPVWDVEFGPLGFYFATASHDRTARLWSCDHIYPLRIFAGHLSDVDVVKFHPNSKYLVTGSSDKTSRLWDVQRGTCVRVFTGHTGPINALAVSPDGRLMASAGSDRTIQLWDLGSGKRLKKMTGHQGTVYSLDFSADGNVLVSGGADCTVRTWDVKKDTATPLSTVGTGTATGAAGGVSTANGSSSSVLSPTTATAGESKHKKMNGHGPSASVSSVSGVGAGVGASSTLHHHGTGAIESEDHLASFATKRTPIYKVQFTKRNLCLAVGAYSG